MNVELYAYGAPKGRIISCIIPNCLEGYFFLKLFSCVFNSAVCLYEQRSSDETPSSDESRRGFRSAGMLPSDQGLICVTADQQFLFYSATKSSEETFQLNLYRRLVGYNEEVLDMRFLGEEQYLAVATNQEQVDNCSICLCYQSLFFMTILIVALHLLQIFVVILDFVILSEIDP